MTIKNVIFTRENFGNPDPVYA